MNSFLRRLSLAAAVVTLAAVFLLPSAKLHGDDFNLKTFITVSQPFQVPGAVLEPNTTYVFRRLDANPGTNHVVRVLNEDQSEVISTFHAVSDWRLEPTDETVLTFIETAPGYPKPVSNWFYPGRLDGLEFIYSDSERADIAAHQGVQAVQTAEVIQEPEPMPQEPVMDEPEPVEEPAPVIEDTEPIQQDAPEPVEAPNGVMDEEPAPVVEESPDAEREEELPRTAGELPLVGLIGLAALGLRHALRKF
jgi:hypothetical protein